MITTSYDTANASVSRNPSQVNTISYYNLISILRLTDYSSATFFSDNRRSVKTVIVRTSITHSSNSTGIFSTIDITACYAKILNLSVGYNSEQTGIISLAMDGSLQRPYSIDAMRSFLHGFYSSKVSGLSAILRGIFKKHTEGSI